MRLSWRMVVAVTHGWRQVSSAKISMGSWLSEVSVSQHQLYTQSPFTSSSFWRRYCSGNNTFGPHPQPGHLTWALPHLP